MNIRALGLALLFGPGAAYAQTQPPIDYPVDSASVEHTGVPKGELLRFTYTGSRLYPGTTRDYWVYIPAEYSPDTPACVYVNQDGEQWKAPTVFDNLIYAHDMPVTIGVFISPGRVPATDTAHALDRLNRSFEYDALGDRYARFLLEELLPDVERQHASDGRSIRLSHSGNDRAIGGSSSGAAAAFTVAWERPDEFSRVFSAIGTYVGLRGADRYPTLIRKYEPKPIRVFLQDGSGDLNIYGGDWWEAAQTMERALVFSGYEVSHVWGVDGHNGRQGTSIFPEAMRWLWKGWPAPVRQGQTRNQMLNDILVPGDTWHPLWQRRPLPDTTPRADTTALSPDRTQLYVVRPASHWVWIYSVSPDGRRSNGERFGWLHVPDTSDNAGAAGVCCDKDGRVYVATDMGIQVLDPLGRVNAILPFPWGPAKGVWLRNGFEAGQKMLEVFSRGKMYCREVRVEGVPTGGPANRPPRPNL